MPGDDVRSIDWNVTARRGRPFVKEYVEERELTAVLIVDLSASEEFGTGRESNAVVASEIAVSTTGDYVPPLIHFFRRRERVAE